jgi:hypothetical protein
MTDLREEIAAIFGESIDLSQEGAHEWAEQQAGRVLAIPEIAEALRYGVARGSQRATVTPEEYEAWSAAKLTHDARQP